MGNRGLRCVSRTSSPPVDFRRRWSSFRYKTRRPVHASFPLSWFSICLWKMDNDISLAYWLLRLSQYSRIASMPWSNDDLIIRHSKIEREMALPEVSYLGYLFVYRTSLSWRDMQREFARNDSKEGMYIFAVGESWSVCPPEGGATSTEFLARNEALPTFLVPRKEKNKKKKKEKGQKKGKSDPKNSLKRKLRRHSRTHEKSHGSNFPRLWFWRISQLYDILTTEASYYG